MQNRNNSRNMNNRNYMPGRLSPLGYCFAGIIGLLVLILFGRILLLLALIGGIAWLLWKFRWALLYYSGRIRRGINARAHAYQQMYQRNQSSQRSDSSHFSNPSGHRRKPIIDVTPDSEDRD